MANGIRLGRARQLQRHQEVRRLPDPAGESVLHLGDYGRPARAHAQSDVIETERERPSMSASRRTARRQTCELTSSFEQQPDNLQEVLIPPDRDPVLSYAAESREDALAQRLINPLDVANRFKFGTARPSE